MAEVELKNVRKFYTKGIDVIKNFNLTIADGEFCIFLGPSGCGKSTVLRMIAGLEEASAGEILIDSRVVNHVSPKDRDIAMVFQSYALYPHKTVYENIQYPLKIRKMPKSEQLNRINEAAEMLNIKHLLNRYPRELSGGERQRVAVGRAIVRKPKVYLFDEPLSNLDAKLRNSMRAELKLLHKRLGITFIYVTHDQVEAMTMGDKIVLLHNGIIQQVGKPLEIYHQPVNRFVGAFIGNPPMNFVQITRDSQLQFGTLPLKLPNESSVIVGVRPEKLSLDPSYAQTYLEGTVTLAETIGREYHYHINLSSGKILSPSFIINTTEDARLNEGDSVQTYFRKEHIRLFRDADDGEWLEIEM